MKAISLLCLLPAVIVTGAGDDSDDHDHGDDAPLCSTVNVTDEATCGTWCGVNKTAEWTYETEHGDFEKLHVDYLTHWECHCEEEATERRFLEGDDEQHCKIPYELPTCKDMGLADCGANATKTCAELCFSVGLGLENGTTATGRRALDHITGQHFCGHHEGGEHDHDRFLAGDDGHDDEEEEVTICYCNADKEAADRSTVACSDADLSEGHNEDHGSGAATGASLLAAAGGALAMALLW